MKKICLSLKNICRKMIGIPRMIYSYKDYLKFISQARNFRNLGGVITHYQPIISEWSAQAGSASGHYFHQDLLVANFIFENKPFRHIDIASRVDGFVAHVASFRAIEVMDVRDLKSTGHKNISFIKANLMESNQEQKNITDSISCLHAIEHFGLGRYGDPIDPNGYIKGFNNIISLLKDDGMLYISFPISSSNKVYFNAHRVFEPSDIFNWAGPNTALKLERFDYVDDEGSLHQNAQIKNINFDLNYGCGIYSFRKMKSLAL